MELFHQLWLLRWPASSLQPLQKWDPSAAVLKTSVIHWVDCCYLWIVHICSFLLSYDLLEPHEVEEHVCYSDVALRCFNRKACVGSFCIVISLHFYLENQFIRVFAFLSNKMLHICREDCHNLQMITNSCTEVSTAIFWFDLLCSINISIIFFCCTFTLFEI